jgi:hypothetical protein
MKSKEKQDKLQKLWNSNKLRVMDIIEILDGEKREKQN